MEIYHSGMLKKIGKLFVERTLYSDNLIGHG